MDRSLPSSSTQQPSLTELRSLWALSNPFFFFWGSDPRTSAQWIPKGFLLILAMLTVKHETEQTEVVGTKNSKSCQFVVSVLQGTRTISTHTPPDTHTPAYKHTEIGLRQRKRFPLKHCLLAESSQSFFCPLLYLFMFWEAISSSPSGAPKRVNIRFVVLEFFFL